MLQINPKRFKTIQNKTIPSPLRPKFRKKNETNIYFLSKRRFDGKKRELLIKKLKITISVLIIVTVGYNLSN